MNLLKLFIPKPNTFKELEELESFTVKWEVNEGWPEKLSTHYKVFIKEKDAKDFINAINEAAKLIGTNISTNLKKN